MIATVVDVLRQRAIQQPGQRAYTFLLDGETQEIHLTYEELDRRARAISVLLRSRGIVDGQRVLLLYPPGLDYIAAFFGCLYAKTIAVPSYPPRLNRPDARLQSIVVDSQASMALTTGHILSNVERRFAHNPYLEKLCWSATDDLACDLAGEWREPTIQGDDLAFLQYTSGSTAAPKGVMLTHDNLLHNLALIYQCFEQTPDSRGMIWLPPYHDMGLIGGILQPLYGGFPVILMSPIAFLQQPIRWLQAISRYRATSSGGPNFAYDLCVNKIPAEQRAVLDLSCWDLAFNGAEPIRAETLDRFTAAFEPYGFRREAFYPCYGLAEATLIVSGGAKKAPPVVRGFKTAELAHNQIVETPLGKNSTQFVGCGQALSDLEIVVVDPESSTRCPPDEVGEIWISSRSVARGYWNRSAETERTFRARLADSGAGPFLRTGDLGFLRDGELFIAGRLKDLIIIRGRNYHPQDIELAAEKSHEALQPGSGAAFSVDIAGEERIVIVQELQRRHRRADVDEVARAIRQAVADEHNVQVYAVVLIRPMSIPKTSSGKIQRHVCRARFLEGRLKVIGRSILDEDVSLAGAPADRLESSFIRKALAAVNEPAARHSLLTLYLQEEAARVLRLSASQVDIHQPLSRFGLDSLMAIELKHNIETSLDVVLPMVDFFQEPSISHLATQVLDEPAAPASSPPALLALSGKTTAEHPLSHGQRAMWFLHRLAPESAAYHIASAVRIRSALDVPALQRAFQALVCRHPSLRTTFPAPQGEPVQRIHDQVEVCFQVEDASTWSEAVVNERLVEQAHRPFDLERGPLLRVYLLRRAAQEHVLLLVVHHIVADFWSLAILVDELSELYPAERAGDRASLTPLSLQYADYARWQGDRLAGPEGVRLWTYWQQQLGGDLPVLNLPTDRPRPAAQTYHGASLTHKLGMDLTQRLGALGRDRGVTLYVTLLAAFQVLLHRYTDQKDILIGSPTAGRNRAALAGLVGYFVNPVVLRADFGGDPSFMAFLDQVHQRVLEAFAHQGYPFGLLVERLQPKRDPSRSPIFQTMFTLQKTPLSDNAELAAFALGEAGARTDLAGLSLESVALEQQTAQFDLTLTMAETAKGLGVSLQYNSDLFDAATIGRMLAHFQTLLEGIVAHPEERVSRLPILPVAERQQLLVQWNNTEAEHPQETGIHQLFERCVERTPEAVAVVFSGQNQDEQLTYQALDRRANQLAHYLRGLGVGPEIRVGICMERSLEMVVGLLGILKAGGVYVPLDPVYPRERLAFILEDAQAPVLLTQQCLLEIFAATDAEQGRMVVCLDTAWEAIARENNEEAIGSLAIAENLAYAIYTSGSTGKPKGVQIPHRTVVNFLQSMTWQPGLTDRDILLSVTTLSFDIAGLEIFLPLMVGAKVEMASHEVASDGILLSARLADSGATLMQATPATWQLLLEAGWPGSQRLRALCGGDAFPRELANRLVECVPELWNMYGPTETTIWSTIHQVKSGNDAVPIGRPIANTQIYILDGKLNPVPVGVPGELYIGGDGLARGYTNRPGLTAEKFVPHPFGAEPGARLYRTGDLVRYRPDGSVEFLGRSDHQVKIRGFRIELAEIESALGQHPAVGAVVAIAQRIGHLPGDERLVAYVVPTQDPAPTSGELRRFLKEKLPDYMIPSSFVTLEALPLTPNGKIDRKALPAPEDLHPKLETAYVMPRTQFEQTIAAMWQKILRVEKVGVHDNFFELGGHSLLMAQIQSCLREEFPEHELSMVELFQYPTVHSLAKYLHRRQDETPSLSSQDRIGIRSARRDLMKKQRERRRTSRTASE